jgi:hypothetical protein
MTQEAYYLDDADAGCVIEKQYFRVHCSYGNIEDGQGYYHPVQNGYTDRGIRMIPSQWQQIPADATGVEWHGK